MNAPCVPDIILERYRLGELAADEAQRVRESLSRSSELRQRLELFERSEQADAPAVRNLAARLPPRESRRRSKAYWIVPISIATATVLTLAIVPRSKIAPADRIKGLQPTLTLYRRTAEGSEALANGSAVRRGDLIRVGYRAAGHGYGVIASIDGRGVVTLHLPPHGARAAALQAGAMVLLEQAYKLDDAPLWERFYFVTGHAPFEVAPVIEAIRGATALPKGLEQSVFSLQKEATP